MEYLLCFWMVFFNLLLDQSLVESKIEGFSVEIFHHDSKLSPFYNHSDTPGELSRNYALRSIARAKHFHPSSVDGNKIESITIPNAGDYLMRLSIGSPPVEVLAIADTGSDLVWIQCEPCNQCYPQDRPVFDPTKSSTYMELSCVSEPCKNLPRSACGNIKNECEYLFGYGGGSSYTIGVLATDSFTFDSTDGQVAAFPNSVFGCGHNNQGQFTSRGSGLVGLAGGPLSLISQLGAQIEHKFSYCLLPSTVNSASKLKFGSDAVLSGGAGAGGVVSTPLLSDSAGSFYYLSLEGISVGGKKIVNNNQMGGQRGNIVIDSGTTLTMLESSFYNELELLVKEAIGLNPVQDPRGTYKLCYDKSSFSSGVPAEMTMVFHFSGADVTLKGLNIFRMLDYVTCLAMLPTNGLNIYGNQAQINFQVEYDLGRKQLSFAPADCTQY